MFNAGKQLDGNTLHDIRLARCPDQLLFEIVCDNLKTPENIGSIIRIAEAVGSNSVTLLQDETLIDPKSKKVQQVAKAAKNFPSRVLTRKEFLDTHDRNMTLYAIELTTNSVDVFETKIVANPCFIVGNECHGVSEAILDRCHYAIHVPMWGLNGSMNVSVALAIVLWEWRRQQTGKGAIAKCLE